MRDTKLLIVLMILFLLSNKLYAQQDEQMSLYTFNPLHFNSAYAGTRGDMSFSAISRAQWVGVKGAPMSQFVSFHSPMNIQNMALGLNLTHDRIGARSRTSAYGNYAYTLKINDKSKCLSGTLPQEFNTIRN
jgi:type IX secretion system PorP/SprF family membrane protein